MSFSANNKLFPSNHKTIFVLDHTPYFGISCESPIEFDFLKPRPPGFIPMQPICKSLWTCSVESALEYCRIVWDIFPQGKPVRFIASDTVAHMLNTWNNVHQSVSHLINALSLIGGVPSSHASNRNQEFTVIHGLRAAVEALSECTQIQAEKVKTQQFGDIQTKLLNRCRVICITSARDNESMHRLEEIFHNVIQQQNKVANASDDLLPIDHCHLVIINTFPVNIESQVNDHPPKTLSSILTTEVHSIKATLIPNKLSTLILAHYDLASTTVTGIPMKEELNDSSSANYDVEIYHASSAHTAILKGNAADAAAIRTVKEGLEYETVTLKWCTPRGCSGSERQNCTSMHRITPVEVNSRPSLCLINFLLNGRSVMLEMARKTGGKLTSHMLAAHGGEIFIHTLCTARSVLEDPPSISEGCGGRVTDYRITDFGGLIQQNALLPMEGGVGEGRPIARMKSRLMRQTKYWPLTISSTVIFNLKKFIDPLPAIITKERITEDDQTQCHNIIHNLFVLETKNESLFPLNSGHQRPKGQKREDQYKTMWNELETLIKKNIHTKEHKKVYQFLLANHRFDEDASEKVVEIEEALKELEQIGAPPKNVEEVQRASVIRATTDSPMSPPPLATIAPPVALARTAPTSRSLLDVFAMQERGNRGRAEFNGRLGGGVVAKLYVNNKNEEGSNNRGEGKMVE